MKLYGRKNETLGKFATELFGANRTLEKNKSGKKELRERMKNEKKSSYVKAWKQKNRLILMKEKDILQRMNEIGLIL